MPGNHAARSPSHPARLDASSVSTAPPTAVPIAAPIAVPLPGLTGAGAGLIGAAAAGLGTGQGAMESVCLLVGIGLWMMRAGRPSGLALWAAMGLTCATACNGFLIQSPGTDGGHGLQGRIGRSTRWTPRDPDLVGYRLGSTRDRFVLPRGSVREAEPVWIAPGIRTGQWARSTVKSAPGKPLPKRPAADEWVRLASPGSSRAGVLGWRPLGRVQSAFEAGRRAGVSAVEDRPDHRTGGLVCALLFGDTSKLPEGFADLFTRTGTRHLLALSGLHVGLLAWFLGRPMAAMIASMAGAMARALGVPWRPGPAVPLALLAAAFVPIAGFGAPATRAALGLSVAALAALARGGAAAVATGGGGRRPSGINILGLALMFELALDPLSPLDAGVQLSYGATAALILVAPRGSRRVASFLSMTWEVQPVGKTGRRRPPSLQALGSSAVRAGSMGIAASIIASFATLPIVWTRFGEWSPVGIVATPIAVPLVFMLVACGWLSLIVPAWVTDAPLEWTASALLGVLRAADHVPWSPLPLPDRPLLLLAAASLAGLLAMVASPPGAPQDDASRWRLPGSLLARLCAGLFAAAILPWPSSGTRAVGVQRTIRPVPQALEVHVLDVGDGNAIVARAPGSRIILFDAGSRDRIGVASRAVAPLLTAMDAGAIDVVLSHNHTDHYRALPWIARRWAPRRWFGAVPETSEHRSFHVPFAESAIVETITHGSRAVDFGGRLRGHLVRGGPFEGNEGSSMLDLRWTGPEPKPIGYRVVLSGDAEGQGLAAMLRGDGSGPWLEPGPVDALLLPHHGSSSRHLGWLLDHLSPGEVWISSSGAPGAETLKECARRGIVVRVTAEGGPIFWGPKARR